MGYSNQEIKIGEIIEANEVNSRRSDAVKAANHAKPYRQKWHPSATDYNPGPVAVKLDPKKPVYLTPKQKEIIRLERQVLEGGVNIAKKVGSGKASEVTFKDIKDVVGGATKLSGNSEMHNQINGGIDLIEQATKVYGGDKPEWGKIAAGVVQATANKDINPDLITIAGEALSTGKIPSKSIYDHIVKDNAGNAKMAALKKLEITVAHGIKTGKPDLARIDYYSKLAAGTKNKALANKYRNQAVKWGQDGKIDYGQIMENSVVAGGSVKEAFYVTVIQESRNAVNGDPISYSSITKAAIGAYGGEYASVASEAVDVAFKYAETGEIDVANVANVLVTATKTDSDTVNIINGVYKYLDSGGKDYESLVKGFENKALSKYGVDIERIYDDLDQIITTGDYNAGSILTSVTALAGIKTDVDIEQVYDQVAQLVSTGTLDAGSVSELISDNTGIKVTADQLANLEASIMHGDIYEMSDSALAVVGETFGIDLSGVDTEAITDWVGDAWGKYAADTSLTEIFGDTDFAGAVDGALGLSNGTVGKLVDFISGEADYEALYESILGGDLDLDDLSSVLGDEGVLGLISGFGSKDVYAPPPCLDSAPPNTRMGDDNLPDIQKKRMKGSDWYVNSAHDGIVQHHMGTNNGEPNTYDVQFDRKSGDFAVWNNGDQFIKIDWANKKICIKSPKCVLIEAEAVTIDAPNTYMTGNLKVYGHTQILKTLNVKDDTLLEEHLRVKNDTLLEEKLRVENDTDLEAKLVVEGKSTMEDDVVMQKDLDVEKDTRVFGSSTVIRDFTVAGAMNMIGGGSIQGPLTSSSVIFAEEFIKT